MMWSESQWGAIVDAVRRTVAYREPEYVKHGHRAGMRVGKPWQPPSIYSVARQLELPGDGGDAMMPPTDRSRSVVRLAVRCLTWSDEWEDAIFMARVALSDREWRLGASDGLVMHERSFRHRLSNFADRVMLPERDGGKGYHQATMGALLHRCSRVRYLGRAMGRVPPPAWEEVRRELSSLPGFPTADEIDALMAQP